MRQAVYHVIIIGAPLLLAALVVGLIVAILQATTSIQEQTLSFVPKIFAILGILWLLAGLGMGILQDYTRELFQRISGMAG
ncbi:MAG: flagellar biosynthesis protein FliQ [Treponema sp.]|nr:flagellar biosynthesis protein FliQ [Treponema sp.]